MNFFDFIKPQEPVRKTEYDNIYNTIKVGDTVSIVRLENSVYNNFKGYIGEIKEYKKGQDKAVVMLHATNYPKYIKVPLNHFKKLY